MHHTSPRHLAVRIEVAPAYELILSMGAAVAPTPPVGFAVPSALLERASQFAQSDWMWAHLITLAAEAPAPRDAAALLSYLDRVSAAELQRRLIGFYVPWFRARTSPARMDAAIRGDRVAARELLGESFPDDPAWQASLRARLLDGPARTKRELLALIEVWNGAVFEPGLLPHMRALKAATRARERSIDRTASAEAVASIFTGWRYIAEPAISRILVVPSLAIGHVIHAFEHGQTQFLCCGLDAQSHAFPQAPARLVQVAKALSDPNRMRIVRALAVRDMTAQELTDRLEIGLATVLHHLAALRVAGVVASGGRRRAYELRRNALIVYASRIRAL